MMDVIASRPSCIYQDGRQELVSPQPIHLLPLPSRKKKPRLMSKAAHLLHHGLQASEHAPARDVDCRIYQERVSGLAATPPGHHNDYSECIHKWLERSTRGSDYGQKANLSDSASTRTPLTPGQFSDAHSVHTAAAPQIPEFNFGPDPQELANRLAALIQDAAKDCPLPRVFGVTAITATSPPVRQPVRPWCLQRRMPLRNRAADPLVFYGLPEHTQSTCNSVRKEEVRPVAVCLPPSDPSQPARTVSMPQRLANGAAHSSHSTHNHAGRVVTIDAEGQLSKMSRIISSMVDDAAIPLRCRAMAKCVWREWREFLQVNDGQKLYASDLLKSLSSSFEQTIIDYGWATDMRSLPTTFVEVMRRTARAAIEDEPCTAARTNTL